MTWLIAFFAKSALMQSPIGGFVKAIPSKAWLALAIVAALFAAYLVHQRHAHKALKAAHDAGYAEGVSDTRSAYAAAQKAANGAAERINSKVRRKSDEEARHINRAADDVQLHGPGRAVCPGLAAPPRATGGHSAVGRPADAAVDQVSDGGGTGVIALPFADTLAFARQCDLNRNEALKWREADDLQRADSTMEKH
jgi:hypothetical protein